MIVMGKRQRFDDTRRIWCADFETTGPENYKKDGYVRVWLWSLVKLDNSEEYYGNDIESFLFKIKELNCGKVYFFNLGFDGMFLIDYLARNKWVYGKHYTVTIDHLNVFYSMEINFSQKQTCIVWDALKKFPGMSLQKVAEMFGIKGKEEKPHFDVYRGEDYEPTADEIEYCLQDSRICAYAINEKYKQNFTSMTLSADAFQQVKKLLNGGSKRWKAWRRYFPLLKPEEDQFFREAYLGGFVQVNEALQGKEVNDVYNFDVNSLYPYVMKTAKLPYGTPFRKEKPYRTQLYFIRVTADFVLKPNRFPILQVKNSWLYRPTEFVKETVEPLNRVFTSTEWELLKDFYDITIWDDPEYYCYFNKIGLLGDYIDYWTEEKIKAGKHGDKARRSQAKLMLNSPYGKTGMRGDRINKTPYINDEGELSFLQSKENTDPIYVPYAAFVTAKAREITIRACLANFENWVYSDTDSMYLTTDRPKGIKIDSFELGAWDNEAHYDHMKFLRPKTYIGADRDYHIQKIACAGLPDEARRCINWDNFAIGQKFEIGKTYNGKKFEGKLMKHRVRGGVMLLPTGFEIKENFLTRRGF